MYVKNEIKFKEMHLKFDNCDHIFILIEKYLDMRKVVVGGIYKSPNCSDNNMFLEQLNENLKILNQKGQDIIIGGDFNFDLIKKNDNEVKEFLNILHLNSFVFTIDLVTRRNENKMVDLENILGSKIDNFIINIRMSKKNLVSYVIKEFGLDHFPIITMIPCKAVRYNYKDTDMGIGKKVNKELIKEEIENIKWDGIREKNMKESYDFFIESIAGIVKKIQLLLLRKVRKKRKLNYHLG